MAGFSQRGRKSDLRFPNSVHSDGSSSSRQKSRATSATVSILNAIALKIHLLVFG